MPVYLISYDLNQPGQSYEKVISAIKKYSDHIKMLDSAYLISTSHNASQINETIRGAFDKSDRYLINHIDKDHSGWLDTSVVEWLQPRV